MTSLCEYRPILSKLNRQNQANLNGTHLKYLFRMILKCADS